MRRGEQIVRHAGNEASLLVVSRVDYETGEEYVIAYNGETEAQPIRIEVDGRAGAWEALAGICPAASEASGTLALEIPALDYVVCRTRLDG